MFPLLSLPNDLIHPIIESLDDRSALISLAQTCSKLRPLAEGQLYRTINIRRGKQAQKVSESCEARPERLNYARHLEVTPGSYSWQGIEGFPDVVQRMRNLRTLRVESPLINAHSFQSWWAEGTVVKYMDMFRRAAGLAPQSLDAPLAHLTSFTFHSHGTRDRYYSIDAILPVFISRTLKHVHLSCVDIKYFHAPVDRIGKTPLQTLVFEECNVHTTALMTILSLPRNLTSLSLRETSFHNHNESRLNRDIQTFLQALNQQSHSLQYLQHICPGFSYMDPSGTTGLTHTFPLLQFHSQGLHDSPGLSKFRKLETLELSWLSVLTQTLLDSRLAPPHLNTFCLAELDYNYEGYWEIMPARISSLASATTFKRLELHTVPISVELARVPLTFMLESRARKVAEIALIMKARNASTFLYGYERNWGLIPPYLYGEPKPERVVCFESERFWKEQERYTKLVADRKHTGSDVKEGVEGKDPVDVARETELELEGIADGTEIAARICTGYHDYKCG